MNEEGVLHKNDIKIYIITVARHLVGIFSADMSYKKTTLCSVKINSHMILIGSRVKFRDVLSSG